MFLLAAVFLFVVYLIIKKRKKIPWFIPPAVLFTAFCSFSLSGPGGWAGGVLANIVGWPAGWFGVGITTAVTALLVLLVLVAVVDMWDKKANKFAIAAFVLVPLLALSAAGPVAQLINEVRGGVSEIGTSGVSSLVGG